MQPWLLWIGFILVSVNLRLIFATVGPSLKNLELGFTSTLLVTTLPLVLLGTASHRDPVGLAKTGFSAVGIR